MDVEVMIESRQMRIDKPIMHTVVYECATKQNDIKERRHGVATESRTLFVESGPNCQDNRKDPFQNIKTKYLMGWSEDNDVSDCDTIIFRL